MHISLKNKHVLVTGGSRGIGKAIACALDKCGATVAFQYRCNENRARQVLQTLGPKAVMFQADFSDAMDVSSLFNRVLDELGHIDILVNNAGIAIPSDPESSDVQWIDDWLKTMDINLNAAGLLCKKAIQHFKTRGGGIIINMASRAAFRGETPDYFAYAASKGGLVALTKSIARSFGKDNIKAFTVAPGFVHTDMAKEFIEKYGEAHATQDMALGTMTEPDDLTPLICLLASGMADHSTGSTFDVNAGSYLR